MATAVEMTPPADARGGPKYIVNTEGVEHPWDRDTITTEEIARLGGWDPSVGVVEIDRDNNERTLRPGEVVELKPGQGFAKKVKFRRGEHPPPRINAELELLRAFHSGVEYRPEGQWVRIPDYPLTPGWNRPATAVAFQIPTAYPGTPPYGIYVPAGLTFNGQRPNHFTEPAGTQPPFGGVWGFFSWQVADGQWRPTATLTTGTNLLTWVRGFAERFKEGL